MLSRAGLAELLGDVAAGTMRRERVAPRPQVVLCQFTEAPTAGITTLLRVKTRNAASVEALVRQDDSGTLFDGEIAPDGEFAFTPLSGAIIRVRLVLTPRRISVMAPGRVEHEFACLPKVSGPAFAKIAVPSQAYVGESLSVIWDAPTALAVVIHIDDGDKRAEQAGASAGVIRLRPTRAGPIVLRLVAQGQFGVSVQTRTVEVTFQSPRIEIEQPIQCGYPGTEVTFAWRIGGGAKAAFLEAPMRNERHPVDLNHGFTTVIGEVEEDFLLIVVGLDGRRQTARLSAVPWLTSSFDMPHD